MGVMTVPEDRKSSAKILEASDKSFTVEFTNRNPHDVHVRLSDVLPQRKSGEGWEALQHPGLCGNENLLSNDLPVVVKAGEIKRLKLSSKSH